MFDAHFYEFFLHVIDYFLLLCLLIEIFGCLEWSHDEEYLLYIAEKKRPKVTSFFDKSYDESNDGVDKKIKV